MKDDIQQQRIWAAQRFFNGESPESICVSLGRSRRPLSAPSYTPTEVEEIVKMVRLNLYSRDLFCGAQAIRWEMEDLGVKPLPSIRTINRILSRNELTQEQERSLLNNGTTAVK